MKKTWLRGLQCLTLCVCLQTTALPVEARVEETVQEAEAVPEVIQEQVARDRNGGRRDTGADGNRDSGVRGSGTSTDSYGSVLAINTRSDRFR